MTAAATTVTASNESCLLKRLGGENLFEFMFLTFMERLEQDEGLKKFYKGWDAHESHKTLLNLAFTMDKAEAISSHPIWLRFYQQFERGLDETHFDIIVNHFEAVLQENWIEQATIDDALKMLRCIRDVFESKAKEHFDKMLETKRDILAVRTHSDDGLEQMQKAMRKSRKAAPGQSRSGDGLISAIRRSGDGLKAMASSVRRVPKSEVSEPERSVNSAIAA
jgi:hypothetical protein